VTEGEWTVKFMLIMQMNADVWDRLTEAERTPIGEGHQALLQELTESGEMLSTHALGDPSTSAVVRVRDGRPVVTDGPYAEAKEYRAGYYLVDVENRERAYALAARIPDAGVDGLAVEVRPVMFSAGADV
jgi:hypothetical protein